MPDLRLDTTTWDLTIPVSVHDDLKDEYTQRLRTELQTQTGEWKFDTDFGVPYLEEVLIRNPNETAINARLTAICYGIEGTEEVVSIEIDIDEIARTATIDIVVIYNEELITTQIVV